MQLDYENLKLNVNDSLVLDLMYVRMYCEVRIVRLMTMLGQWVKVTGLNRLRNDQAFLGLLNV